MENEKVNIPLWQKFVVFSTTTMILLVAAGAFVLSFTSIKEYVEPVYNDLAWVFPLIIDLALTVFLFARFAGEVLDDRSIARWALVLSIFAGCLSIFFNVGSVIETAITNGEFSVDLLALGAAHIVVPILLIFSVELTVKVVKSVLKQGNYIQNVNEILANAKKHAENMIEIAEKKSREIVNSAQTEAESLINTSRSEALLINNELSELEKSLQEKIKELEHSIDIKEQRLQALLKVEFDNEWSEKVSKLERGDFVVIDYLRKKEFVSNMVLSENTGMKYQEVAPTILKLKNLGIISKSGTGYVVHLPERS